MKPLSVAWNHNVDPPVPHVIEAIVCSEGIPGLVMRDDNESLRIMWDRINTLQDVKALSMRIALRLVQINAEGDSPIIPPTAIPWITDEIVKAALA